MRKWEIYLAYVQYEDVPGGKIRPVLVIDEDTVYPICCLKMTSHPPRAGEYELIRWQNAGLRKPTTVRIQNVCGSMRLTSKRKSDCLTPLIF